jgi:uncharacterized protein (DUF58 family)
VPTTPLWFNRLRTRAALGGRLHLLQPWALLPGPLALGLALAFPFRWLFFLGYAWLFLLLCSYLWVRIVAPGVRLQRSLASAWAEVGDELTEEWELENSTWLPLIWLELDDSSTVPGYSARRVAAARPHEINRWRTSARCVRRGVYTLGPLNIRMADPLGIFGAAWSESETRQIVVYPPLVRLPDLRLPRGQSGGLARADLLQQATTPSVGGLREYVSGDMPSRIHWPTVARTERLMVKEFDQERAGALWIALDLCAGSYRLADPEPQRALPATPTDPEVTVYGQSSLVEEHPEQQGPDNPLELAVVLAGSLAALALAEGRAVGLIADDGQQRVIPPGQGPRQLWRILGALVDAQASGELQPGDLITRSAGSPLGRSAGAALALITPDLSGSWLAQLASWQTGRTGGALVLLSADAGARAEELSARLTGLGANVSMFRVGEQLPPIRPPRPRAVARVSPLGRLQRP